MCDLSGNLSLVLIKCLSYENWAEPSRLSVLMIPLGVKYIKDHSTSYHSALVLVWYTQAHMQLFQPLTFGLNLQQNNIMHYDHYWQHWLNFSHHIPQGVLLHSLFICVLQVSSPNVQYSVLVLTSNTRFLDSQTHQTYKVLWEHLFLHLLPINNLNESLKLRPVIEGCHFLMYSITHQKCHKCRLWLAEQLEATTLYTYVYSMCV